MIIRALTFIAVAVSCTACANDPVGQPMRLHSGGLNTAVIVQPANALEPQSQMRGKTMSDKVLTAIALEKVTGRKPDPARLSGSRY